jgi:PAS fold
VLAKIKMNFMSGEPWEDTFPIRSKDGDYRWFLSRALPIRDPDGRIIRWFGTNTDITDRLKADEQRERCSSASSTTGSRIRWPRCSRSRCRPCTIRSAAPTRGSCLSHDVLTVESWEGAELRRTASRALEFVASRDW